uniref:ATP-dependent DNA helicase PIF1-like n=1 Tax=Cicer arietinum TaxID=3827 RepID=A0A1S2XNS4_CICAR|nr:ATP-dependent DNA helicase PIF1-like [Cicer arietinum]
MTKTLPVSKMIWCRKKAGMVQHIRIECALFGFYVDRLNAYLQSGYNQNVNMNNLKYYEEMTILVSTHDTVDIVNDYVLSLIPDEEKKYISSDLTFLTDENCVVQGDWITLEFLNDIKYSGISNHRLRLKIGVLVMLLRNIDQTNGLSNGTRFLINELSTNIIGATVFTGKNIGDKIYIPRINLVSSDPAFPFKFQRRQFPLSLCFAITIHNSQGQSLSQVGLYLKRPVFTHGQWLFHEQMVWKDQNFLF